MGFCTFSKFCPWSECQWPKITNLFYLCISGPVTPIPLNINLTLSLQCWVLTAPLKFPYFRFCISSKPKSWICLTFPFILCHEAQVYFQQSLAINFQNISELEVWSQTLLGFCFPFSNWDFWKLSFRQGEHSLKRHTCACIIIHVHVNAKIWT